MKLLIVEDHPIVISGCRALFAEAGGMEIEEARTAADARLALTRDAPDVTIIDINLPDGSGLELTREFVANYPDLRVVVFSMNETPILAVQALQAGAKGYVSKTGGSTDLREAVFAVARGETWVSGDLIQAMALLRAQNGATAELLNERERLVLRMLARGRSMAEIANDISVSYKTVASDCALLRKKLGARTSTELVRIASELKLI
ncbi:response regulator transcription factor [Hyphomicrobium sp.]|uniref:response regulator transcription factor n=1 Tax=Hyphomicrobium sp. TaxID=82 RepID=UPI000FA46062|nr:response regulator transcription factor [Hyphomicrobium sp.]RUO98508.1 MAG: response regulator transcription factor [Hyphomicrobium sp.]